MRNSSSGAILVLFARPPVPGEVKSRLAASLGEAVALDLYLAFLRDSIELLHRVSPRGIRPAIAWAAPVPPRSGAALGDGLAGVEVLLQEGEDLGQRMSNCIATLLSRGNDRVVLIGADTPSLPIDTLYHAFDKLRDRDLVLGPSEDGGYYLLGARSVVPEIFRGIPWGTDRVLTDTLRILKILNIPPYLLAAWSDVDTVEDLERLRAALARLPESDPTARHTRTILARLTSPSA